MNKKGGLWAIAVGLVMFSSLTASAMDVCGQRMSGNALDCGTNGDVGAGTCTPIPASEPSWWDTFTCEVESAWDSFTDSFSSES